MKSKINFKSLLAGVLIGASIMSAGTVFADYLVANNIVEAWMQDRTVKIMVDNKIVDLGADNHILNYQGKLYTPARLVAEQLGAEVKWDETTNMVTITSPEPEVVEVEVEKVVYVDSEKAETKIYEELPTRTTKSNVTFRVLGFTRHSSDFELRITFENDSRYHIYPNTEKMYLEDEDGNKYEAVFNGVDSIYRTGVAPSKAIENIDLYFQKIPKEVKNLKVVIPVDYEVLSIWDTELEELTSFTTYIELDY